MIGDSSENILFAAFASEILVELYGFGPVWQPGSFRSIKHACQQDYDMKMFVLWVFLATRFTGGS